ncbi:DUF3857 domain-containing protein [Sungkyunkwania multivorans]|uniref:DUF3857 domain-containing protein n=1 Tax=Sungkyunkwania multivorans TaxID=1173618 RepID=A0ABW3D0V7_9FLAO
MLLFVSLIASTMQLFAQEKQYSYNAIPEELLKGANAVVRLDETSIEVKAIDEMEVVQRRIVTVLNKEGDAAVDAYVNYDPNTKVKKLEAIVYDMNGNEIKKIKKNDFNDVSAVDGGTLYADNRTKYLRYTPIAYPYTVKFECITEKINTAFIPSWIPIDSYSQSYEKTSYSIKVTEGFNIRTKEKNFEYFDIQRKTEGQSSFHYELKNVPSSKYESYSPSILRIHPYLLVALDKFHLEGVDGSAVSWEEFGRWRYEDMIKGRDLLPESTKTEVEQLVQGIEDPIAKAKKIYEYVQDNTRYISVQLGIGGWSPIEAEEVDRVKYGDCKGLTNYTKALLASQGIESYYTVLYAGNYQRSIESDFASMQSNHVILNIPNGDENIWLECTSQVLPFNFLGDFTDNRDVLVLTPEGGKVKHTHVYLDEDNSLKTVAEYSLSKDGKLTGDVIMTSRGIQYNDRFSQIGGLSEEKQQKYYKEYWDNINNLEVSEINLLNIKDLVTYMETVNVSAENYATATSEGLLFQLNPFNVNDHVPKRYRNRKQPFEILRGYLDTDEYTITLPQGYKPSSLPAPIKLSTKYGDYEVSLQKVEDNTLKYTRKFLLKHGFYPKEEYNAYRNFRRKVAKGDKLKIILVKQQP